MDQRIRRYIRAKQKLITLLEEQKQAIIHHAVRGVELPNLDEIAVLEAVDDHEAMDDLDEDMDEVGGIEEEDVG